MTLWPQQWEFVGTWVGAWGALQLLSCCCGLVDFVATGLLAVVLADLSLKAYDVFLHKRENISDVSNKAVFITGCDSGFGFHLAERLSRMGFKVFAGCLSLDSSGAKELSKEDGLRVLKIDVTKQEDIDETFKKIKKDVEVFGLKLWSIVNNAGIAAGPEVEFQSMESYRLVFEVNTMGPVMVTKAFLPLLRAPGQGRIVNVASQAGRFSLYGLTSYSMSKHALISFSDGLRLEMKKWNITVHTIEPAFYRTNMVNSNKSKEAYDQVWEAATDEVREAYGKEFFDARVDTSLRNMESSAEPEEKLYEVIDDLVDAIAGTQPKIRYIPGTKTKMLQRVLRHIPFEVADRFWMTRVTKEMPRAVNKHN